MKQGAGCDEKELPSLRFSAVYLEAFWLSNVPMGYMLDAPAHRTHEEIEIERQTEDRQMTETHRRDRGQSTKKERQRRAIQDTCIKKVRYISFSHSPLHG
jgi:hypothetical protein